MSKLSLHFGDLLYVAAEEKLTVQQAFILPEGTPVAVKRRVFSSPQEANFALREAFNMAMVGHPGILRVLDCYLENKEEENIVISIVSEFMPSDLGKDLATRRKSYCRYSELELWTIFTSLISALSFAEKRGICHRDIKPDNIFLSELGVKIGNFGSSSMSLNGMLQTTLLGSPLFLSPELKRIYLRSLETGPEGTEYDAMKSDVYSLAVTMLYLALLGPPTELANLEYLEEATYRTLSQLSDYPSLCTWLAPMLSDSPATRPSFTDIESIILNSQKQDFQSECREAERYICLECKKEIVSWEWTETVAGFLKPFKGFFEVCCSEVCLEARANTFPRNSCVICCTSVLQDQADRQLNCGHKYHIKCRSKFPVSNYSMQFDCPQCYPNYKLKGSDLNMMASWSADLLMKGIAGVPKFQQAGYYQTGQQGGVGEAGRTAEYPQGGIIRRGQPR